jgi:hypothetical protein
MKNLLRCLALIAICSGAMSGDGFSFTYLPNCGDCTLTTPCETECGWDPGKGGPVTCGEYGICDY